MKKKILKIFLDIVMAIMMICLLNSNITGIKLHEILGIAVFFVFVLHKILNFKWIKAITKSLFRKNISTKAKIMYAIDILLLVLVTLNVFTGILISTYIFTYISAVYMDITSDIHHWLAYLLLATLIVHVALHGSYIRTATKMKKGGLAEKIALCCFSVIITAVLMSSNTFKRSITTNESVLPPYHIESLDTSESVSVSEKEKETSSKKTTNKESKDKTTQSNKSTTGNANTTPSAGGDKPTIEEFLSKIICRRCGKGCLLISPDCSKGRNEQQQQVQIYNETYGTNETYASSDNKKPR